MFSGKVEAKDIINVVKEITFNYKNCNVVVKENNGIINIGITGLNDEGYIIEKHKTIFNGEPKWELTTQFLNNKIDEIESLYQDINSNAKDKNLINFEK